MARTALCVAILCFVTFVHSVVIDAEADRILSQHNDVRAGAGVAPLSWDSILAQLANEHVSTCPIPLRHSGT